MDTKKSIKIALVALVFGAGFWIGRGNKEVVTKTVEVETIKEVVNTETVIVEKPGGEKTTIVRQVRTAESKSSAQTTKVESVVLNKYIVGIGSSISLTERVYNINVQRRLFGGIHAGIYGRSDNEFGVILSITF